MNSFIVCFSGSPLGRAIYMGSVQSFVTHAVYRLWPVPTSKYDRHLANHTQYVEWCYLLCTILRSYNHTYTVI